MDSTVIPFETERAKALKGQFVPLHEIEPCLDSAYLVQGWLGLGGFSVLYGPSNSGKTFVTTDLAMHVASGINWRGQKIKPGPVIYVASEGGGGIRNRLAAIRKAKPQLRAKAGFYLLPTHLDLHASGDAMALCSSLPVPKPSLIIVDTMARSMGAGDENSAKDVSQFVANVDAIRERTGAHVLVVHHSGKNTDAGARGSSALRAAVDSEIAISERQISCPKQRDMEMPGQIFFDLETVELGQDADGDPVNSAVVIPADAPTREAKPLTGRDEVAANALMEALRLHGQKRSGENFPVGRQVVTLELWKAQCGIAGLTDPMANKDTQRKAFTRAKERLIDRDFIRVWQDFVWKVADND